MKGIECAFFGSLGNVPELKTSKSSKPWASASALNSWSVQFSLESRISSWIGPSRGFQDTAEDSAMKWLISYQRRIHYRYASSKINSSGPLDTFEISDEHPVKWLINHTLKFHNWADSTWDDRPEDSSMSWRADEVRRIYSAVQVPDDMQITKEEMDSIS